jgi:hypothetical protein
MPSVSLYPRGPRQRQNGWTHISILYNKLFICIGSMPHGYERFSSKFVAFHVRPQNNMPIFPKMAVTKFCSMNQSMKTVALMKQRRVSSALSTVGPNVHAARTCPSQHVLPKKINSVSNISQSRSVLHKEVIAVSFLHVRELTSKVNLNN